MRSDHLLSAVLAKRLNQNAARRTDTRSHGIPPVSRDADTALSGAQHRLWLLEQLDAAAGKAYTIATGYHLRGKLDVGALRKALARIVFRHEILRTTVPQREGVPFQRIAEHGGEFVLVEHDLRDVQNPQEILSEALLNELRGPFSLADGPLARGRLIRVNTEEFVLVIHLHHIVSDGWSTGIFLRELCANYAAASEGQDWSDHPLGVQYVDYAAWHKDRLDAAMTARLRRYWTDVLAGAPTVLELPTDRRRPATQSFDGARMRIAFSAELLEAMRRCASDSGLTMFVLLVTAWSVMLARLSGQLDVVVGTPVANRVTRELESTIGFFVNTLALRVRMDDDPSIETLLSRVQQVLLDALEHQELPFDQVVEAVNPPRTMRHSPIFQTVIALNNTPGAGHFALQNCLVEPYELPHLTAQFELALLLTDTGDALYGILEYSSDLFDAETIERYGRYFLNILGEVVKSPESRVSEVVLMAREDREEVLVHFQPEIEPDDPMPEFVHRQFERVAESNPDAIAVSMGKRHVTYSTLNVYANIVAQRLRELGVRPDDRIALCAERSIEQVVGLLAVLKAGAAYVPMDPGYPQERLDFMLEDSSPVAVLVGNGKEHMANRAGAATLVIRDLIGVSGASMTCGNLDPAAIGLTSEHCAYVIYTSGSTGRPKGAMVPHRGLSNLLAWYKDDYGFSGSDRVLAVTSFSFDLTQKNLLVPLLCGGQLVLAPNAFDPLRIVEHIERERISTINLTPSFFSALVEIGAPGQFRALRRVFLGGEPVVVAKFDSLRVACPEMQIINSYGPTECSDVVAAYTLPDDWQRFQDMLPPIGKPIRRTRIYLLDEGGEPVPVGISGEIYVAGCGVSHGYLNRPELTSERFVPAMFAEAAGMTLYRTGDLGRWTNEGNIQYLGRNDFQFKYRGFRIEPGEIEARITEYLGVQDVVVTVREDVPGNQQLVAYLVMRAGNAPPASTLRAWLLQRLPDYMVPGAVVQLDVLPVTPSGKLDRRALPAPSTGVSMAHDGPPPQGRIEIAVAEVWQTVLHCAPPGRQADFFAMGGHSLLAVQVIARLRDKLGVRAAPRDLFAAPTLCDFAACLEERGALKAAPGLVAIRRGGTCSPLFLIHPGEGEIGYVRTLAAKLPLDRPVYGIAAKGLQDGETPCESVKEMAAAYLAEIRSVQEAGPFWLGGWSAGGTIAYEMAAQLRSNGEDVALLALIDTTCDYSRLRSRLYAGLINETLSDGRALLGWFTDETPATARERVASLSSSLSFDQLFTYCKDAQLIPDEIERDTMVRHLAVRQAILLALLTYEHKPIDVPLHLFRAADTNGIDIGTEWERYAGAGLEVVSVAGNHYSIMGAERIGQLGVAMAHKIAPTPVCRANEGGSSARSPTEA